MSPARTVRARFGVPHRMRPGPALAIVAALVVAACGASTPTPSTASLPIGSVSPGGSPIGPSASIGQASAIASSSTAPTDSAEPTAPASAPASDQPTASGPAAACTGTAENQDFYARLAGTVAWTVYCPVLPAGWFLKAGSYRLADGGRVDVTYTGPGGAKLDVHEGAFCAADPSTCSPGDAVIGQAAFGDRAGQLASLGTGFVVTVDAGKNPSWQLIGSGLGQDAFTRFAAAMAAVGR